MNTKIFILFGLLAVLAVLATAENNEENSISEEVSSSRIAREAEADAGRRRKSSRKGRKMKIRRNKGKKGGKKRKSLRKKKRGNKGKKKNSGKGKRRNSKKRTNKKNKKNSKGTRKSTRTVDGVCLENAMTVMRRWKDVVANFEKQKTRIDKQGTIAGKKSGKQSVFGPIALKLVDLGGGNKSALTCSGSATSEGALQLTNLTTTLFDCEVAVNASCTTDFPMPNMTFVDACANDTSLFVTLATECVTMSKEATASEACACWSAPELAMASEAVKDCKIPEVSAIAQGLKACKAAFSTCRKFEDEAVSSMAACSVSVDTLKAKAAALSANHESMTAAKSKVSGITSSRYYHVKKNSALYARHRGARAAASTCAAFISLVQQLIAIALDFPSSSMVLSIGVDIVGSSISCTADEITTLSSVETSLEEAASNVEDAFNEAQSTLEDATGTTLSNQALNSIAGVTGFLTTTVPTTTGAATTTTTASASTTASATTTASGTTG